MGDKNVAWFPRKKKAGTVFRGQKGKIFGIFSPSLSHNSLLLAVWCMQKWDETLFSKFETLDVCRFPTHAGAEEKRFEIFLLFRFLGTTWVAQSRVKMRHFEFFFAKMHFLGEMARGWRKREEKEIRELKCSVTQQLRCAPSFPAKKYYQHQKKSTQHSTFKLTKKQYIYHRTIN